MLPLTEPLAGGAVRSLRVSERGDWQARLDNGVRLVMDRGPDDRWVRQVVTSLGPILGERLVEVERVDMRYGHGFAVRWKVDEGGGGSGGSPDTVNTAGAKAEGRTS